MTNEEQVRAALESLVDCPKEDVNRHAAWALGFALLDVAAAIREQTAAAERERQAIVP